MVGGGRIKLRMRAYGDTRAEEKNREILLISDFEFFSYKFTFAIESTRIISRELVFTNK